MGTAHRGSISPDFREGGSEQIREGASNFHKTSQNSESLEEFLVGLRFEQKGKLELVPINNNKLYNHH